VITISQLDIARKIDAWRKEKPKPKTFSEIAKLLGFDNPEKARSIYRRYQSDLTDEISYMSILDRVRDTSLLRYTHSVEAMERIASAEKEAGYGQYLVFSDIHVPFEDVDAIKTGIFDARRRGIKKLIINGDLFHLDAASNFAVTKDQLAEAELNRVKELLLVFANEFEKIIIVEGNHDSRLFKELTKSVKNGLKRFIQNISAIQTAIDELNVEDGVSNIYYTQGNELWLGNVLFCHPDHFSPSPGKTVMDMVDTYLPTHRELSGVVIGHTHYDIKKLYRGIPVFETGCLCFEPDYRLGAKKRRDVWTTAYAIIEINKDGDLVYENSHVIPA